MQLINNVIDTAIFNAVKAKAKNIKLIGDVVDEYTVIHIKDDGCGFPEDVIDQQGRKSLKSLNTNNTGLGLFFARQICEMHRTDDNRGHLELSNNNPEPGACLTLQLPS